MNPTIHPTQSNTQGGSFTGRAGVDLTGLEGRLVALSHDTGVPEFVLPTTTTSRADYLLLEGAADGGPITVVALERGRNYRVRLAGTCNPGDELTHGLTTDAGKVRTVPAAAGTYFVALRAEEKGVAGQLVLVRPILNARDVVVPE